MNRLYRAAQVAGVDVTRREVKEFLSPVGEQQVYYRPPNPWPGAIKKPTDTDSIYDLDTLDLQAKTRNVAGQRDERGRPYTYLAMMQDRFRRKLYAHPVADKTP